MPKAAVGPVQRDFQLIQNSLEICRDNLGRDFLSGKLNLAVPLLRTFTIAISEEVIQHLAT
ncbi:hypothetical protein D3C72_1339430 [compost metagenome]